MLPESDGYWLPSHRSDARAIALYRRHYSAKKNDRPGRQLRNFMGPGATMVLLTADCRAVFAWAWNTVPRWDHQTGVCCVLFRNEGPVQSSVLIREADALAWQRWPAARLFTYVDPSEVASVNPGACFLHAGWRRCGVSKVRGLLILERLPVAPEAGSPSSPDAYGNCTAHRGAECSRCRLIRLEREGSHDLVAVGL